MPHAQITARCFVVATCCSRLRRVLRFAAWCASCCATQVPNAQIKERGFQCLVSVAEKHYDKLQPHAHLLSPSLPSHLRF